MTDHTVKAFGEDLRALSDSVARMGEATLAQLLGAIAAIAACDVDLAARVVAGDDALDVMEVRIEHQAARLIALRQPMALDLRQALAAMKIAGNLERCGDLAKSVAKRVAILSDTPMPVGGAAALERLGRLVVEQLERVLLANARDDLEGAHQVWRGDRQIDETYEAVFREILTHMMSEPRLISAGAHLLFMAKNLERIGDHATNIAEVVGYRISGEPTPGSARPKWDALTTH